MSKLQHTSGPWKYTISKNSGRHQISDAKCGGQVCAIWSRGKDITEANARLIAAAPEMLEALMEVAKYWQYDYDTFIYMIKNNVSKIIEKATGMSIEEILK
jgi:hypothetical protein